MEYKEKLESIFNLDIEIDEKLVSFKNHEKIMSSTQTQTGNAFSDKWGEYENSDERVALFQRHQGKFLEFYGFDSFEKFQEYLQTKAVILDAGCGLGDKTAWFAKLAPNSLVIGMDISESVYQASEKYQDIDNLFFIQNDIANTNLNTESIDFVICDQVIMHTDNPKDTFAELTRITKNGFEFACYMYKKKALPHELLDDYFRDFSKTLSHEQLMELSKQLTELGKNLSELNIKVNIPSIPLLGIEGGEYDIQRFMYYNFLKCYYNKELGNDTSVLTNYDWYAPSNATRYSEDEYKELIFENQLSIEHFFIDEARMAGRFKKEKING